MNEDRIALLEQRVSSVENELKHIDKSLSAGGLRMQTIENKIDGQTVALTRIEMKLEQNAEADARRDESEEDLAKFKRKVLWLASGGGLALAAIVTAIKAAWFGG